MKHRSNLRHAALAAAFMLSSMHFDQLLGPSLSVHGFIIPVHTSWVDARKLNSRTVMQRVSTDKHVETQSPSADDDDGDAMSDEDLLRRVQKSQLIELCEQYHLPIKGTKTALLKQLRDFADQQAALDRQRRLELKERVEEGADREGKERYEIVSDEPENDLEDEGYFFFHVPGTVNASAANETAQVGRQDPAKTTKQPSFVPNSVITAPPPPPTEPDENGERVVTVYSTKEQNDLTGVAAAQPGQNVFSNDAMMTGSDAGSSAPWDMKDAPVKAEASSRELEEAKETVTELVYALLSMTGAPAFREEFSEGLSPMTEVGETPERFSSSPEGFVGFDPVKVPTDILTASSMALRADRGHVLQDVLRDYELRAVGHDGMAGDDVEKGGGHYREVSKVRAFLEGYRRAEVRRVARETTTMLLDKLVSEGVEGLDFLLASMSKNSDDTGDAGELSDSLLEYLNDAIRQQERRVEQLVGPEVEETERTAVEAEVDSTNHLWNVTTEEGQRVESLDPNDPKVQKVLKEEYEKSQNTALQYNAKSVPSTAPEQLLLLLTLLRERIKAEGAFTNDEKGRNLRILAYCLNFGTDEERESLIMKQCGKSIDRLDSFIELVASSIEYSESTTHQLQPSKSRPLNLSLLKSIHDLANDIRDKQAWKASGVPSQS